MSSLFIQAPCSLTLEWEDASASLATALETYMDLCLALETKYLRVASTSNLVDRIDSKFVRLHDSMKQQLFTSRSALARTRNRLASSLYRFPEEILSQIFMEVIHDHHPTSEGFAPLPMEDHLTYTYRGLHTLIRVCSVWRNVALRRAALWSTIPILNSAFGSANGYRMYRETELSLQRAVGAGLHFAGVLDLGDYQKTKLIPKFIPRFHTINLKSKYLGSIHNFLEMILDSGIPSSLHELSICHIHDINCKSPESLPDETEYLSFHECRYRPTFQQLIRSVSVLRVSGIPFHWHAITFSTNLVELRIQAVTLGYESELNHLLKAVATATQLRKLSIISLSAFPDPVGAESPMPISVDLPKLQTLYVEDLYFNVLDWILTNINPGSHRIKLYLTDKTLYIGDLEAGSGAFEENEVDPSDLCDLLGCTPVDTLILYGDSGNHWVAEPVLRRILCSIPSLKTLMMSHWEFDTENLAALVRHPSQVFAQIQNLHLTGAKIFDIVGLKRFIASHPIQNLDIGALLWKGPLLADDWVHLKPGDDLSKWLESRIQSVHLRKVGYEAPEFKVAKWQLW
ncbi:unnamed protein product [Rhizoctonia solani]|uniref:F-box domain-containing protein n=1 Tax=Rhizoctonia solani TaxID=456999 RepID=A0A8H3AD49_9AGAM|nr:unnamed protein product [Rhizoctonia solani]